ncbi:MAG: radical SAM protein [Elusimicrobia bacterium]|nr:radical SAM protein [Elusimicrobiota bacterium]
MEPRLRWTFSLLERWVEAGVERAKAEAGRGGIRELHLELTHRCNLKCVMCHHWEMPFKDPGSVKREMGLEEIRRFADSSRLLDGVEIIVLTGGEPWLRTDIVEISAYLSRRFPKASLGILSNFWNTEMVTRRLRELESQGVERLWLGSSLDGLEANHDEVRGQAGSFQGLMKTAEVLRRDFPRVDFSFSFTITPRNYRDLWPAYELVSGMGLWFGAQMVVNHQKFEAPETFEWKPSELDEVEGQMDRILLDLCTKHNALEKILKGEERESLWLWTRVLYWWYLKKYSRAPARFFKDCMAGERYAMLSPEGDVFFCPVNKHRTVGNVRAERFDALWTSRSAEQERRYVESCKCDCWLNCIANPILDRAVSMGLGPKSAAPAEVS